MKKHKFAGKIIGCDSPGVMDRARNRGAIDEAIALPADAVRGSEVVVLASPVGAIIDLIGNIGPALPAKTLLTDVGSTKAEVLAKAKSVFGKAVGKRFLAGHPMAGKEQAGVESADADLFEGAAWLFTPLPRQNRHESC